MAEADRGPTPEEIRAVLHAALGFDVAGPGGKVIVGTNDEHPGRVEVITDDLDMMSAVSIALSNAGYGYQSESVVEPVLRCRWLVGPRSTALRPEQVEALDLGEHVGRLVALHRGRLYEILAVGPARGGIPGDRVVPVTVPAARTTLLGHPIPVGHEQVMQVQEWEGPFPVVDAPADPRRRAGMILQGHRLRPRTEAGSGA